MVVYVFRKFIQFTYDIRYWEWQDKIQNIVVATLLLLYLFRDNYIPYDRVLIMFMYLPIAFGYGYLINSYADQDDNAKASRKRIWVLGLLTFLIPFYFQNVYIVGIVSVGMLLTAAYSLNPFRLKSRGILGLVVAAATQRLMFLFFIFILPYNTVWTVYLFGWLLILGLITEASQQLRDYTRDKENNIKTYAYYLGISKTKKLIVKLVTVLLIYMFLPIFFNSLEGFFIFIILVVMSHVTLEYSYKLYSKINDNEN